MTTRIVTGTLKNGDGSPWAGKTFHVGVTRTTTTTHGIIPGTITASAGDTSHLIPVVTDQSGAWSVPLETGVPLIVILTDAAVVLRSSTLYPAGSRIPIVVPAGEGPISLETILASEITPPDDPTLPNMVAKVEADFADLQAGLPGQITDALASDATVVDAAALAAQNALYALTGGIDGGYPSTSYDGGIVADGGTP